jgi:Ni,Fe-hydrogenase III small subunit
MHINTGSCNGCDIEVRGLIVNEVEFVNSVEDADLVVFTGPVNKDIKDQVTTLACKISAKKVPIVVIGSCTLSGGICQESEVVDPILVKQAKICVFGCPPGSQTILEAVKMAIRKRWGFR